RFRDKALSCFFSRFPLSVLAGNAQQFQSLPDQVAVIYLHDSLHFHPVLIQGNEDLRIMMIDDQGLGEFLASVSVTQFREGLVFHCEITSSGRTGISSV